LTASGINYAIIAQQRVPLAPLMAGDALC